MLGGHYAERQIREAAEYPRLVRTEPQVHWA